jgi:uncharacterized protein YkwD
MNKRTRISILFVSILLLLLAAGLALADWGGEGVLGRPPEMPAVQPETAGLDPQSYLPVTYGSGLSQPWLNTQNKNTVRNFYLTEYLASEGVPSGWNGNHTSCNAGSTTAAFKQAVLTRVNFFRAMAGISNVASFKNEYNNKAQEAALMMSVNNLLSHSPPTNWTCYTADGAEAAGYSNLYLGIYGPSAITGYIRDAGGGNEPVGHRRWILYPQTVFMGTGDIPPTSHPSSNALWVIDLENIGNPRPDTREPFVSWPPPGYVPYQVVFERWSFGYALADLTNVTVTMTKNGQPLSLQQHPVVYGFGERTLVWEPNDTYGQAPTSDIVYNINVNNVIINGQPQNFSYQVIIFAP